MKNLIGKDHNIYFCFFISFISGVIFSRQKITSVKKVFERKCKNINFKVHFFFKVHFTFINKILKKPVASVCVHVCVREYVWMKNRVCVCVRERVCMCERVFVFVVCMCLCVKECERVCARRRDRVCVCVCV